MRVAFDARALDDPALSERGIGRYAASLLAALLASERDVVPLRDLRRPPAPRRVAEVLEHAMLARDVRRIGADVLHSPAIDLTTTRPGVPYVVTVHDLVPMKQPERYLRSGLKHRLRYAAVRRATRLVVPTAAVGRDCERLLGADAARVAVVAEAAAPVFGPVPDPEPLLARFRLPEHFLLWVGGLDPPDPRKGLEPLVAALDRRGGPALVLAGRAGARAAALAESAHVLSTGRVSDEELAALYTAADALVLPSEEEGFGLPAVEALACGTPVAAYDIESLRELHAGRDDVRLVEPGSADGLLEAAAALAGTHAEPPSRNWGDVGRDTWAVYESALRSA